MPELPQDAAGIARAVRAGQLDPVAVAEAALSGLESGGRQLNLVNAILADHALGKARAVREQIARGEDPGPLAGVPFGVKNLFDVQGITTLAGSIIEADNPPAEEDASAVQKLEAAGGVLCCTQQMDEYAYGFSTENAHYGPCHNPHDTTRITGGSSGGSAACVAAGLLPLSIGSDTNGSIRVPSSLCGVYGLRPTYGRVSRAGAFPFAETLDCIGPFARSTADLALAYNALLGPDSRDPVLSPRPPEPIEFSAASDISGLRIARLGGYFTSPLDETATAAINAVADALGVTREADFPEPAAARSAAFLTSACEGGRLHLDKLRRRAADYDFAVRRRLIAGTCLPAGWYLQAQLLRKKLQAEARKLFGQFDVLLAPATPVTAPPIGEPDMVVGGVKMNARANLGIFTQPVSFLSLPVITVPCRTGHGMPVGVQLIGAPFTEPLLFRVARFLESHAAEFRPTIPALS